MSQKKTYRMKVKANNGAGESYSFFTEVSATEEEDAKKIALTKIPKYYAKRGSAKAIILSVDGNRQKKSSGSPIEDEKIALLEHYIELMRELTSVYKAGGWGGTESFGSRLDKFKIKPETKTYSAFRYIILTEGLDEEDIYGPNTTRMAQLDWSKLIEPYQSWSKSLAGAESFLKDNELGNAYPILLEGKIEGFVLKDYASTVIEETKQLIKNTKEIPGLVEDNLDYVLHELESEVKCYSEQDEIISVNVIDFIIQIRK
jgi:hypothetical protein